MDERRCAATWLELAAQEDLHPGTGGEKRPGIERGGGVADAAEMKGWRAQQKEVAAGVVGGDGALSVI